MTDPLDLALDLMRRMPPSSSEPNLDLLVNLLPNYAEDLVSSVDHPLRVKIDDSPEGLGREFLCCDYNRDADSYRSWMSNTFHPPLDADPSQSIDGHPGNLPSPVLRQLEIKANEVFETYTKMYYDSALSSVYLWDLEAEPSVFAGSSVGSQAPSTFAGAILIKKAIGDPEGSGTFGSWDSLHVFEATEQPGAAPKGALASASSGAAKKAIPSATYKLTSTVMLSLGRKQEDKPQPADAPSSSSPSAATAQQQQQPKLGKFEIAGSLTRQTEGDYPLPDFVAHLGNVGKLVEDVESRIRSQLQVRISLPFPPRFLPFVFHLAEDEQRRLSYSEPLLPLATSCSRRFFFDFFFCGIWLWLWGDTGRLLWQDEGRGGAPA
ncbi:F-actin-capping protein subunit beta [Thecaphora frezii]